MSKVILICAAIIIFSIITICYLIYVAKKTISDLNAEGKFLKQQNKDYTKVNNELSYNNKQLLVQLEINNQNVSEASNELARLSGLLEEKTSRLQSVNQQIKSNLDAQTDLSTRAYENYCNILEQKYQESEREYNAAIKQLSTSYENIKFEAQQAYEKQKQEYLVELEKLKATKEAAIEAARREKEIKEKSDFYCLKLTDADLSDISKLESIKKSLNKPRVLSMLIWQTWFQKPLKALSVNVLGNADVMGIYKITNVITGECYIGQAVNVRERWAEHAKCGLGIDTPVGNKLYAAMLEYGLWSFSWELLEKCPREQLNEKEKFYINMYQADTCGYNSNKGIDKIKKI